MDSEPEETLKERAQNLQNLVRGPLASSIQHLSDSSRNIPPGTDFHFFNNFPAFRQPITIIKNRSESLLREIGASQSLWKRPSRFPADPDEAYDWLVNIHDDIFERVDVSMDEFKRVRQEHHSGKPGSVDDIESGFQLVYGSRRKCRERKLALGAKATAAEGDISGGVKVLSRDKKTSGGRSRVPFHIPSIPRPQDRYNIFVDNSNVPFKHPGLQKTEDGSKYIHPLQGELDKIEFAYNQSELPEPLQPAPWESTPFKFVERVQDLKEVAMKLESASEIAVDLEHNQYRSFQGLTCLMQISTRAEDFVVDTLILRKYIGPCLKHIFANPAIKKVMHGADRDILWLQRDFGIFICNLFDTGQASRVLQLERNSLEFLLQHFCDITADKEYQTADWRLRPLPSEMLKYAREDTHYLLYIHDVMQQRLKSMPSESGEVPLFEVYKRSCDICLQIYEKELLTETSYLHVYGLQDGNLSPEQLSVAAGLYEWRDKIARVEDESTGYILPNKVLLQIAKRIPRTTNDLRAFVNGRHPFVERNLAAVLDVIKQAREMRNKAVEISRNPLEQVSRKGADGLKEISDTCNQPLLVSADIADAVNARNVSYVEGLDAKVGSLCENSSQLEVTEGALSSSIKAQGAREVLNEGIDSVSIKSDNRENISSEQTGSLIEKKQAEFIESSSSAADTCFVGTASLKKAGLASTVVGRASNSLLFNKKCESVKGSQAIVNESKGNPVCQSLEEQSQCSLSMQGCSSGGPAVVNLENKMESSKQENKSQLIKPSELSNSEKLVQNGATASDCSSLQPNCVALEEAPEIRDKVSAKSGVTLVQAQKRPTRGLAAMLGPSRLKQKSEMSSKVYDTEQDSIRSKVEQIKASVALPFHSLLGTREMVSIQHPLNSEEVPSNEESQVEVGKLVGAEVACSNAEIENNMQALKISAGIVSEEGRKYRAWWPPLQVKANGKKSSIRQIDDGELPPSLSELRRRSWQQGKRQSSFEFQQNTRSEAPSHFNEYLDGKKRKTNLPATRDSNNFFTPRETDGSFKPFDYAAARRSMSFGISEERARDVKDRSGSKNLFGKKGKGSGYDPMNLGASEAGGDLQPGKRRQVFPASGNRSATFR